MLVPLRVTATTRVESGDQTAVFAFGALVTWVRPDPSMAILQISQRPLRVDMKSSCLPSGDHFGWRSLGWSSIRRRSSDPSARKMTRSSWAPQVAQASHSPSPDAEHQPIGLRRSEPSTRVDSRRGVQVVQIEIEGAVIGHDRDAAAVTGNRGVAYLRTLVVTGSGSPAVSPVVWSICTRHRFMLPLRSLEKYKKATVRRPDRRPFGEAVLRDRNGFTARRRNRQDIPLACRLDQ